MGDKDRLRLLGAELAKFVDESGRTSMLGAIEHGDMLAAMTLLLEGLRTSATRQQKLIGERTFQLELVLDILRTRDKAAAKQAEWDFAADLQLSGLPQEFPPFPGRSEFDLHAGMVTAKEVGGDLYDFFLLAPDRLGFVVADAAGKGLPAAIFITLTRTLLRAAAQRLSQPGECLDVVNAMLCIDNPTLMFSTAFYGVLDTGTGEILYANAGHNPPYALRNRGNVEAVTGARATALGITEDTRYPTQYTRLTPGETLVCFSDGLTEAIDSAGALYGETRLERFLAGQTKSHPTELLGAVIGELDSYMALAPMADDVTLLVLRYNGDVKSA